MYFGAITFTLWFRLECFAVYASSPLLPPETQDSLRSGLANPFLRRDSHPQDQYSFAQRTVHYILPEEAHLTGKAFTQRIKINNLTHRTRIKRLNRKTIGYSKSEEMHDKVIGTFIERENYV